MNHFEGSRTSPSSHLTTRKTENRLSAVHLSPFRIRQTHPRRSTSLDTEHQPSLGVHAGVRLSRGIFDLGGVVAGSG